MGRESGSVGVGRAGGGIREDSRIQVVKIPYIYACKYRHNETFVHNKYLLLIIKAEIQKNKVYHKRDKNCSLTSFKYEFIPVKQQNNRKEKWEQN